MADPRRVSTRRAVLSYEHLKQLTNWKDLVVKDYQGILQDTSFLADEIDAVEIRVIKNEEDIVEIKQDIVEIKADIVDLQERVSTLEYKTFTELEVTDNYTTEQFQFINCRNTTPIEITLKQTAVKDDEVHIKRNNAEVTVIGVIDGVDDYILPDKWSIHLIFNGANWSIH